MTAPLSLRGFLLRAPKSKPPPKLAGNLKCVQVFRSVSININLYSLHNTLIHFLSKISYWRDIYALKIKGYNCHITLKKITRKQTQKRYTVTNFVALIQATQQNINLPTCSCESEPSYSKYALSLHAYTGPNVSLTLSKNVKQASQSLCELNGPLVGENTTK